MNLNPNPNTTRHPWKRLGAWALGASCVLGMAVSPAAGQVTQVDEPYVVVVDTDAAPLRCGADELYYEVDEIEQGTMLLVDATDMFGVDGDGWLRVSFPDEQPALVKALPDHLDVDTMRGTLTLLRPSRLIALSIDGDLSQSWKKLLAKPMEPGSTLRILETIRDENGEPLAYLVPAPEAARGFIHGRFVRQATAIETVAFHAGQQMTETTSIAGAPNQDNEFTTPAPTTRTTTEPVDSAEPITTVASNEALPSQGGDVGALLGIDNKGAEDDARAPAREQTHATYPFPPVTVPSEPITTSASAEEEDAFGVYDYGTATSAVPTAEPEPIIENRPLPTMRDLESAYAAVLAQKAAIAEVDPLIGEHKRYLAAMRRGEAPGDNLDREVLVAHLEMLKIRSDLQRSILRIEGVREQAERSIKRINEGIASIDRSSEYVVVGRLTTSVVYDGKRLPLLYRVQSIDEDSGRTLAYIVPARGIDLAGSLGSIVGVAGSVRIDASSRLNIVTPTRVDRLRAGDPTASAQ